MQTQEIFFDGFSIEVKPDGIDWLVESRANFPFGRKPSSIRVKPGERLVVGQGDKRHVIFNPVPLPNEETHFGLGRFCGGCELNSKPHKHCIVR